MAGGLGAPREEEEEEEDAQGARGGEADSCSGSSLPPSPPRLVGWGGVGASPALPSSWRCKCQSPFIQSS